jgi:hypothetical protein
MAEEEAPCEYESLPFTLKDVGFQQVALSFRMHAHTKLIFTEVFTSR